MTSLSVFLDIPKTPKEIEKLQEEAFLTDTDDRKVILQRRELVSDDGQPWVPPPVRRVYLQIISDPTRNYEPQPITGSTEFIRGVTELALGKNSKAILENRASGIQTVGSTGAFRVGAEFLRRWYNINGKVSACIPLPAYDWYLRTFEAAGVTDICPYRFWDSKNMSLALPEMLEDLQNSPDFSVVVLPTSCNPTGIQLANSEWKQIADIMKKKNMFPFFHLAAQGLASGDLEADAWPLRYFVSEDFELFCAQSFSANFGLYGESVGNLLIVLRNNEVVIRVRSQLEALVQGKWSTPPAIGSRVVATVLNNPTLYAEWKDSLKTAVIRLLIIREKMRERMRLLGTLRSWEHITKQGGLFAITGLTSDQVDFLAKKKHVYLCINGQINISGLNATNLNYVTQSINDVILKGMT
ncbi:aspartate aminotransferase, cytoplasmic-like isoform X2 [Pseudophryne corroboree]|uniref:aspartate aminotransferase, cytoplasmic-like isoform X2 n=1 Tax=Pseudophryne corroboree TaxID=495146 RepID=UPI003081977C